MSLGTFTEDGISTSLEDGSAIFIGVSDTTAAITSIVFGIEDPPSFGGDFAIGSLSINASGAVPEPSSLILAAIAIPVGMGSWWLGRGASRSFARRIIETERVIIRRRCR